MDRIETDTVCHALAERLEGRRGKTLCGRTVSGSFGVCVVTMITCQNCRRVLRARGWQV